ncbi:protein POLLENLESS 3-LIKE 2 [Elaeis guineensis]|uniref:Protein POLLENLESS 3-LIKE 2 isoform X2 n=1 Tax=Elaeis guineensis var. tenera TaxID=51953 RepID=A0A8N4F4E3_ELAGV|nr:protein POLLENLESS 3-LIKE 2 isoform X2 [Elaeis guineensis]
MMQDPWNITVPTGILPSKSSACSPIRPIVRPKLDSFHITHKVPVGDTPYVKAKRVQLVEKDPEKAIALFWAAINAGDRVDSALKDMAIVMKQQNRAEEAIEAIKSLRNRCTDQAQESLDNILLDLYKRCGRLDDQIALLKRKLQLIEQGLAFNGKCTKTARSQGRKFQVSVEQEATRLLGNLGWALMQKDNYAEAEAAYRRALRIGSDNNKMCNLGICLIKQGRIAEAKETLKQVRPAVVDSLRGADSHLKAYERAQEMLHDLEAKLSGRFDRSRLFDAFIESSSIWQPHPCIDYTMPARERFADENVNMNRISNTKLDFSSNAALNIDAPPFYSSRMMKDLNGINHQLHDPMCKLKRTRSGNAMEKSLPPRIPVEKTSEQGNRRKSLFVVGTEDRWPELPDTNEFNDAIVAAVLAPVLEDDGTDTDKTDANNTSPALNEAKMGKRLRIFQDITQA